MIAADQNSVQLPNRQAEETDTRLAFFLACDGPVERFGLVLNEALDNEHAAH